MRRALVILTLILLAVVAPTAAQAQPAGDGATSRSAMPTVTTKPPAETLPAGCVDNSIGGANCGVKPQHSGDRGGAAQTALFGLVLAGMALIFLVIVRSTRARDRAIARAQAEAP
jgi:hypothetical protein